MLVLLSAPRGRVSAARVAARAREDGAEVRRIVTRLPASMAAEGSADGSDGGASRIHHDQESR